MNRRVRTRTHGGVGGRRLQSLPLSRLFFLANRVFSGIFLNQNKDPRKLIGYGFHSNPKEVSNESAQRDSYRVDQAPA
jgi:hypothetical protein